MKIKEKLLEKAKNLPKKSGCYLMLNSGGEVIYVGKAKSLKARVSSYFQNGQQTPKTIILVSHIRDFEFLLTENEAEALVLENNLIKKHRPRYNIMMRDDKSYPYVVVDFNEDFPKPTYRRRIQKKENLKIYGPFAHGSNISEVLRIAIKSFGLRDCSIREFNSRKTPCLLYQIKQCTAACVDYISKEDYLLDLEKALSLFDQSGEKALSFLENKMQGCAQREEFEQAALIRDHLNVLNNFINFSRAKNVEYQGEHQNVDIIGYFIGEKEVEIAIYMMRQGKLLGHKSFHFPLIDCIHHIDDEVCNFIFQYYFNTTEIFPELIILPFEGEIEQTFREGIHSISSMKINHTKNDFKGILELTQNYAKEQQQARIQNEDSVYIGLEKLKDLLGLKERPVRLECYDIAIFQGSSPTAAQVVSLNGHLDKKEYRHYNLQVLDEGNNDFAMMEEVLTRRIDNGQLPDVFIVDGGKGQLNIAQKVLEEKGIEIPVIAIAKSKGRSNFKSEKAIKSEERLFIPGRANHYVLKQNMSLFRIITQLRDEAHRFSRRLHHKGEKGRVFKSWLDEIPGIGVKTKKKILTNLSVSPKVLKEYSVDEIVTALNISKKLASKIKEYLNSIETIN